MAMRIGNVVPAVVILGLSAAIFFEARGLEYYGETTPGPAFFPLWLAAGGIVLAILQVAEARRAGDDSTPEWPERSVLVRVAMTVFGLAALVLLAPILGMMPCVALFMAFLLLVVLRRPLWPSLATLAVTVLLIHLLFVRWLAVPLPTSSLGI
jgi:putative tricarboxylic transport membrane protein